MPIAIGTCRCAQGEQSYSQSTWGRESATATHSKAGQHAEARNDEINASAGCAAHVIRRVVGSNHGA